MSKPQRTFFLKIVLFAEALLDASSIGSSLCTRSQGGRTQQSENDAEPGSFWRDPAARRPNLRHGCVRAWGETCSSVQERSGQAPSVAGARTRRSLCSSPCTVLCHSSLCALGSRSCFRLQTLYTNTDVGWVDGKGWRTAACCCDSKRVCPQLDPS